MQCPSTKARQARRVPGGRARRACRSRTRAPCGWRSGRAPGPAARRGLPGGQDKNPEPKCKRSLTFVMTAWTTNKHSRLKIRRDMLHPLGHYLPLTGWWRRAHAAFTEELRTPHARTSWVGCAPSLYPDTLEIQLLVPACLGQGCMACMRSCTPMSMAIAAQPPEGRAGPAAYLARQIHVLSSSL